MHRAFRKFAFTVAGAAVILGAIVGPALADPPAGTIPALTDIVGMCPPPLTGVMNAFSAHYDSFNPAAKVYCWNGQNPGTGTIGDPIRTKGANSFDTTCQMTRPATDSAALAALEASPSDKGHPCIDFASTSHARPASAPPSLIWIPLAKDAVSWTSPAGGVAKPASLTPAQLNAIYTCVDTNWNQVGGGNAPIVPVLPLVGSDTRDDFLNAIIVHVPGACVVNGNVNIPGDPGNPVPIVEDTGVSGCSSANWAMCTTGNAYEFATNPNAIVPYSVASWIAQEPAPAGGGHATALWAPGVLRQPQGINGPSPILTHSGPPVTIDTINPAFPAAFQQSMWTIVRNAGTAANPVIPAYLVPVFGPVAQAPRGLCSDTADMISYGFTLIGAACGVP